VGRVSTDIRILTHSPRIRIDFELDIRSMLDRILEPEVTSVFVDYKLSLQRLFRAYSGLDSQLGYTNTLVVGVDVKFDWGSLRIRFSRVQTRSRSHHLVPWEADGGGRICVQTWELLQRVDCRLQLVDLMKFVQDKA
jgi:hypothetical protein